MINKNGICLRDNQTSTHMRLSLTILLCLLLVHCSENSGPQHIRVLDEIPEHIQNVKNLTIYPGDSEPLYEIELNPVHTFGETGEPYLTEIMGCVVDDEGRVVIWDMSSNYDAFLYVFNADGPILWFGINHGTNTYGTDK